MRTKEIIKAITNLPVGKRMFVIEQALRSIRKNDLQKCMASAAEDLLDDYLKDNELTAFSQLDFEDFYEAK
jgi:hypothetical protein